MAQVGQNEQQDGGSCCAEGGGQVINFNRDNIERITPVELEETEDAFSDVENQEIWIQDTYISSCHDHSNL